uniref:ORC-CDC6 family AAA ATPase n=1 Tax=Undibacterium sp. TaxID=1914977 RepID=UPI0037534AD7
TKTVIGDPVLKAVDALRQMQVIEEKTKIFVRIDQYEQLTTLNVAGTRYGSSCQELIHKALAARDGRVSYRIGTRTHGWDERPAIYSTTDVLERKRDFDIHDMDEIFRRRENRGTWWFPEFAQDIFLKRMKASEYDQGVKKSDLLMSDVLGKSLTPSMRADGYVKYPESRRKIIEHAIESLPLDTPDIWNTYIKALAERDVLAAWLCCAWIRQKAGKRKYSPRLGDPPTADVMPWVAKPYWHKERVQLGLMQLASANRQAPMWGGETDVISLSDGQILVFLFLLQHIWDAWLRDRRGEKDGEYKFPIRPEVQSQGVREASAEWLTKQTEGPNAHKRKMFVNALGKHLYVKLTDDKAMSNPGANGFTLENGELAANSDVREFLMEAVGYGDLVEAPHISKTKGERRTKYYLVPILSPYFRIPSVHTKEPEYVTVKQVRTWLGDSEDSQPLATQSELLGHVSSVRSSNQKSFWDEDAS